MGIDQERTGDTARSDQVDVGPEGDPGETDSDTTPDAVQGAVATAASGDVDAAQEAAQNVSEVTDKKSLFWWCGQMPVQTGLKKRCHDVKGM